MKRYDLTDQQMAAVRMAVGGAIPADIARTVGVTPTTVSLWRKKPEYKRAVDELSELATARAVEDAAFLRGKILRAADKAVDRMIERIDHATSCDKCGTTPADLRELASGLGALGGWYKTVSGQTGVVETTATEVTVSAPDEARRLLREQLRAADPEVLRAMEAADGDGD